MKPTNAKHKWPWLNGTLRSTRWSLIGRVRNANTTDPEKAAEEFCQCYWYPLYSFLRRSGYSEGDAQDHVQSFLSRLLEGDLLAAAHPLKGRLRSYLITLLTRHVASRSRRERAKKRGGGVKTLPLEWLTAEQLFQRDGFASRSPEEAYRLALAGQLVAEGIAILRRHYANTGKLALCEELLPALEGPLPEGSYDAVAARLGMRPGAVRTAATRMRERFRLGVRESAAGLLGMEVGPELDAELREIFCAPSLPTGL